MNIIPTPLKENENIFNIPLERFILPTQTYINILAYGLGWTIFAVIFTKVCGIDYGTKKKTFDSINRHLSSIYAIIVFCIGIYDTYWNQSKCGMTNNSLQHASIEFSIGYFIYDTIFSYKYGILDPLVRLPHHVLVIISEYECLVLNSGGFAIARWALYLEASNPPMQYRNILKNAGLENTKHFILWEILYFGSYALCRVPFILFLFNYYSSCTDVLLFMRLAVVLLMVQSTWLISLMLKSWSKRLQELKERNKENISLYWFEVNPEVEKLDYVKNRDKKKIF